VENLSKELQRVQVVTKRVLEKSSEETREPFGTKVRLSGGLKLRKFLLLICGSFVLLLGFTNIQSSYDR
jgi:hypothetical protein